MDKGWLPDHLPFQCILQGHLAYTCLGLLYDRIDRQPLVYALEAVMGKQNMTMTYHVRQTG